MRRGKKENRGEGRGKGALHKFNLILLKERGGGAGKKKKKGFRNLSP